MTVNSTDPSAPAVRIEGMSKHYGTFHALRDINLHLGPADRLRDLLSRLQVGQEVKVDAFRTAKMADRHYVAQRLTSAGTTLQLRDADLRPFWAGPTRSARGRRGRGSVERPHRSAHRGRFRQPQRRAKARGWRSGRNGRMMRNTRETGGAGRDGRAGPSGVPSGRP